MSATPTRVIIDTDPSAGIPGADIDDLANDPEAAHVVFRSGAPLPMVGLDVTTLTCLTLQDLDALTAGGTPAARLVRQVCAPWIRFVGARRGLEGCWLHDPLAVGVVLDRPMVTTERMEVGVELRGETTYGQTVDVRPDGTGAGLRLPRGGPVAVCTAVDTARFTARFLPAVGRILKG